MSTTQKFFETSTLGEQKKSYVSPVSEEMVISFSGILCDSYPSGTNGEQSSYTYYGDDEA